MNPTNRKTTAKSPWYKPTADEIRNACRSIQRAWNDEERQWRRRYGRARAQLIHLHVACDTRGLER